MKTLQINHQRHVFGEQDRFINTCLFPGAMPNTEPTSNLRLLIALLGALFGMERFDLLIIRCLGPVNSPWSFVGVCKVLFRWLLYAVAVKHKLFGAKVAVLDHTDHVTIHSDDKKLLKLCDVYFKRELARNAWNTLECVLPYGRCIEHATTDLDDYYELKTKLRPISLGIHSDLELAIAERKYDFFYVGMERGIAERGQIRQALEALSEKGYRVYLPDSLLSAEEYKQAIADSWFCPSPMGCGWDCYRHYEIISGGSIPLLSKPSITAYHPFGSHNDTGITLDYDNNLEQQLVDCLSLSIPERLDLIGKGQQHVKVHHSFPSLGKYMVKEAALEEVAF